MANTEKSIWRESRASGGVLQPNRESAEIIEVDNRRIDSFVQQNSPVNNEMIRNSTMNELWGSDVDGQMRMLPTEVVVREKHGKIEPVISYVSFQYEDDVDLEILNKNGRYKITAYDRRVYNAVSTLYLNGRKTVSLSEIYSIMTGYARTNPNAKQIESIERSLNKLKSIKVFIDLTDEVKHHMIEDKQPLIDAGILKDRSDKIKSAVIEDNMLHFRVGTIESEKGRVFKSIQLVGEPTLLTYNRAKKTLLSIPMEFIGLTGQSATDKIMAFQDYLLMRIFGYKNKKMRENKVVYDTLYRDSGQERPKLSKDFIRDRETICKMMEEWKNKGLITGYEEVKEGRSYTGIIFYTEESEKIEEKKAQ